LEDFSGIQLVLIIENS